MSKIVSTSRDSGGVKMQKVAATEPQRIGSKVWLVMVTDYEEESPHVEGIYSSEESAKQALMFATNTAPDHTSAYIQEMGIRTHHPGGNLRVW